MAKRVRIGIITRRHSLLLRRSVAGTGSSQGQIRFVEDGKRACGQTCFPFLLLFFPL